ncbi:MAG TPA: type II toxin-antitoxin system HicA family toxin [Allosphingosinicella sp.]|nr:type II toxin-antitoxin system HicA family toxin [Allosphingosinicella sp.]
MATKLRGFGFEPTGKQRGSHEGWINRSAKRTVIVPRHAGDMPDGTLRAILRQAGIGVDDFLAD